MKKLLLALALLTSTSVFAKDITLTAENTLSLSKQVDTLSVGAILKEAVSKDSRLSNGEPLYLVLNTPGGSIDSGRELIEVLKNLNRPVHTVTVFAASMGFQIVQGLNDRYMIRSGTLMSHKASGGLSGEIPGQFDSRYAGILEQLDEMDDQTVARSGKKLTKASYRALYENELWVTSTKKALKLGLIDSEVAVKCDKSLDSTHEEAFNFMGFQIALVFHNCPVITSILDVKVMIHTNQGLVELNEFLKRGGSFDSGSSYSYTSTYSSLTIPSPSPSPSVGNLYALTPGLSVEEMIKKMEQVKSDFNNNRKRVVKYGNSN